MLTKRRHKRVRITFCWVPYLLKQNFSVRNLCFIANKGGPLFPASSPSSIMWHAKQLPFFYQVLPSLSANSIVGEDTLSKTNIIKTFSWLYYIDRCGLLKHFLITGFIPKNRLKRGITKYIVFRILRFSFWL